ncbi:hypothetical protein F889_02194 [Acinetobacter colistiniresistens]|uniref:DUF2570 domain-containing protein n=1 Tax=Acinetobacter colistiniresistens TaxID=280145 RepID=N9PJD0_9GAMM|nr:hypothetical protein [Acinetobacter colistiniresistens]ENX33533.1 hypothetical protein F889_02194 [Acinetobacter colistiniresistens]
MRLIIAAKFWREILIVFLAFLLLITLSLLNHKSGQVKTADQKCFEQIQKIEHAQVEALAKQQDKVNKVSADYEKLRSEQRTKVETVTRTVQKIVERPVYFNRCIDDDGVRQINSLIEAGNTS